MCTRWISFLESGGGAAERSSSSGGWGEPRPPPCLTHTPSRQAYIPTGARRGRFDASHDSWELEANLSVGLAAAFRKKRRQQASAPEPRRCAEPPREPVQEAGLDGEGPAAEGVVRKAEGLQLHLSAQNSTGYLGVLYDRRTTGLQAKPFQVTQACTWAALLRQWRLPFALPVTCSRSR